MFNFRDVNYDYRTPLPLTPPTHSFCVESKELTNNKNQVYRTTQGILNFDIGDSTVFWICIPYLGNVIYSTVKSKQKA